MLVHGLWMNGLDMILLGRRLSLAGFTVRRFRYPSVKACPADNAVGLQEFTRRMETGKLHFVCHSLGGLVVRHLFHLFPGQRPGRVVTLGTPHQSSQAANILSRRQAGRRLLGRSLEGGLLGNAPPWAGTHELGVIAGNLRLGMGMIIPGIPQPSDGTVAVAETRLAGMADHIVLPVSHFGMLFAGSVAGQTIRFLHTGRFDHDGKDRD